MVKRFKDFINENDITSVMMSSGGEIRGLGHVTGDASVGLNFMNTWIAMNAADADTQDQIMNAIKKSNHDDLHAPAVADVVKSTQDSNKPEINKNNKKITDIIKGKR
jgi:hypothetical protein